MATKENNWSLIVRASEARTNVWRILHIKGDWIDENVVSHSGPHTTKEVCAMWDTMLAWSRYIELEGVGPMEDPAQFWWQDFYTMREITDRAITDISFPTGLNK
jgi:hypothetical protein